MDGFTGFKTATTEELPDAVAVMDPVPRRAPGRRRPGPVPPPGPAGPSTATAAARATRSTAPGGPCTPAPTCSPTSRRERLTRLFAVDEHVEVEATWGIYQRMIAAYREPDRARGRELMTELIDSVSHGVPAALTEVITLGRTLKKRAADVLAYFDRPGTSQRTDRGDQRPPRAPTRLRPRVPQPHQLHRQIPARDRRLQTPTTPSIVKSPKRPARGRRGRGTPPPPGETPRGGLQALPATQRPCPERRASSACGAVS